MKTFKSILSTLTISATLFSAVSAQKAPAKPAAKPKPIIFAVLFDGKSLEPIAYVNKKTLEQPVDGGDELAKLTSFSRSYYKPNTIYRLIFGGADAGTVTVKHNDPKAECSTNIAEASFISPRAKLTGNVMALATNAFAAKKGSGVRRLPTAAERSEVEALVRSELAKQNVDSAATKPLKSQNLTALDIDGDGSIELVGSYWVDTSATTRALLFFITDKGGDGKYSLGISKFQDVKQDDVMSTDIKDVDTGAYHERLLDIFDYDGDGTAEVFTYIQGFEGAGFNAYKREAGKWTGVFEGSNYHCGY